MRGDRGQFCAGIIGRSDDGGDEYDDNDGDMDDNNI